MRLPFRLTHIAWHECLQRTGPACVASTFGGRREVRARIDDTEPIEFEDRDDFVARLRLAVRWVNANRSQLLLELCSDQKSRAREVLKLEGSRTSF